MKKVAIFDLDGTLIDKHIWEGIMKYHFKFKENRFLVLKYIGVHFGLLPLWKMKLFPTKKYFELWGKNIPWMLKGLSLKKIQEIFLWLSENYLLPSLKKDIFQKKENHQKEGFLTILISGTFSPLLSILNKKLNFDFLIGTELETKNGFLTGKIIPPLCFSEGKKKKFEEFLKKNNFEIDLKNSFAYADSIFDLPILEMVGNPVVVGPDKKLFKLAQTYGWQIC